MDDFIIDYGALSWIVYSIKRIIGKSNLEAGCSNCGFLLMNIQSGFSLFIIKDQSLAKKTFLIPRQVTVGTIDNQ